MRPFILLQLSDLHFGEHSRFHGQDLPRLAKDCATAIASAREDLGWQEPVGLVLVTGDLTEAARPKEYRAALEFFSALVGHLSVDRSRVVFVPGNHDVSWTKCLEVQGLISDGELDEAAGRTRIDQVKLLRFDAMVSAFYRDQRYDESQHERSGLPQVGDVIALHAGAYIHDFADLEVSVAALNSCERESHRKEDHVGLVSPLQEQAVLEHWLSSASERLRIIAVHHNPLRSKADVTRHWVDWLTAQHKQGKIPEEELARFISDVAGFEGAEPLQRIAEQAQVSLVLHGHHHFSDKRIAWGWEKHASGDARVISAGTWSLKGEKALAEQPVVMQLVRIDPHAAQARAVLLRYDPHSSASGNVRPGNFVLDGDTLKHAALQLSLPARLRQAEPPPRPPGTLRDDDLHAALQVYRLHRRAAFERWDLRGAGAAQAGRNRRPVEATLDDMYVPLELARSTSAHGNQPQEGPSQPASVSPEDVFRRRLPMVVLGSAGSGKTTWMRWTYRRLLSMENALPFFVELRAIGQDWPELNQAPQPIRALLEKQLRDAAVSEPQRVLEPLLAQAATGPRPVLLVDGWDELGDLGEQVRLRLQEFRNVYPRVLVVVSSRPYGVHRPAGAEGFETLEIQPLRDELVALFAERFYQHVGGENAGKSSSKVMLERLQKMPEAQDLARTALLLTMLLSVGHKQLLPNKRHNLYRVCLESLLYRRVQRERKKAQHVSREWRPDNHKERMQAASELAYRLQSRSLCSDNYSQSIVAKREDFVSLLPESWSSECRDGFVEWLINSAGLLVDRTDDTVSFAHLSFQEFLSAWNLREQWNLDQVRGLAASKGWWETLRLWASLISDHPADGRYCPISELMANSNAHNQWLVGAMLSDGVGHAGDFSRWCETLSGESIRRGDWASHYCARAWSASSQDSLREKLHRELLSKIRNISWIDALAMGDWARSASLEWHNPQALQDMNHPLSSERALARSRIWLGASWLMPAHGGVLLLRLWPSKRSRFALSLQSLSGVGSSRDLLSRVLQCKSLIAMPDMTEPWWRDVCRPFRRHFVRDFGPDFGRAFRSDFARNFGETLGLAFCQDYVDAYVHDFGRDFGRAFNRTFGRDAVRSFVRSFVRNHGDDFIRNSSSDFPRLFNQAFTQDFRRDFFRDFAGEWGISLRSEQPGILAKHWNITIDSSISSMWQDFIALECRSLFGRSSVRPMLATDWLGPIDDLAPEIRLFRLACRASLHPKADATQLETELAAYRGDPLWPALARHISRRSTAEDRVLLEELAAKPELREGVLSWGLRYYVRGDLVLNDGTVLTLDQLCDELGLPHLPLLEDMPDELPEDLFHDLSGDDDTAITARPREPSSN